MSNAIYVGMSGLRETMVAQTIHSNNLANVKTPGFRADVFNGESLSLLGENLPTHVYASHGDAVVDLKPGHIITTGRDLDVAIQGKGLFAVQTPEGKEAYTRAGNFKLGEGGQLLTGGGHPVLGNGGPIAIPPAQKIEVAQDGTISMVPQGADSASLVVLDRIKLVNFEQIDLVKNQYGLLEAQNGQELPADPQIAVSSGALEGSNVNAVSEMVNVIAMARQFEVQMKLMSASKENDEVTAQLLQQ